MIKTLAALVTLAVASSSFAMPAGSRVTLPSGKRIFVSGMNLAWINYAGDVGNTPLSDNSIARINTAMKAVHDSGGNTMRIWLSTDGTNDPIYGSDGYVQKPGESTIANIQKMLQLAKANNILLMPVLLTHNWTDSSLKSRNPTVLTNNIRMLTTDSGLSAYIKNYLIPVVTTIGNDPNLICWEVYNEAEGMVDGWSSPANTVTKAQVQKSVNRITGAIKRAVPGVLVSNGAAYMGAVNWYTDANLVAAGGDADGKLDFYMVHYYGWNGSASSPFIKNYAAWNFDKPLVIGEYASSDWGPSTPSSNRMLDQGAKVDTLMDYLNRAGYAGGLGWQYQQDARDGWMRGFTTFGHSMRVAYRADSNSIKLDGTGNGTFSVSVGVGPGGKVVSNPAGRIDSGKSVTLTATALPGYSFTGWSGDTTATTAVLTIPSVSKDLALLANFKPDAGTNLLKNGDFTASTGWDFYVAKRNAAAIDYTTGKAVVTIDTTNDTTYHIQLSQLGLNLVKGTTYLVTFDASASIARKISVGFSGGDPGWVYLGGGDVELTTSTKPLTVEITPTASAPAAHLQFNLGGKLGTVTIDNVAVVTSPASSIRTRLRPSVPLSIHPVAGGFEWRRSAPLADAATVRVLDVQGRELHRAVAPAGSVSGFFLPGQGPGLRIVVLEGASERDVRSLPSMP